MSLGVEYKVDQEINHMIKYLQIQRQAQTKIWTTKEGIKIKVEDMSDKHIINTTKLLEKNNIGDYYLPWILVFYTELDKRGIKFDKKAI